MMALLTASTALPDWRALESLHPDARVTALLQDGKYVTGQFRAWSPEGIEIASKKGTRTLGAEEVRRLSVEQKGSRWKGALIGALIGFGVAFPFGVGFAGQISDRNNPGFAMRAGMGTGFGMFGAGIGAPLGALGGGKKNVTIYRAPASSKRKER